MYMLFFHLIFHDYCNCSYNVPTSISLYICAAGVGSPYIYLPPPYPHPLLEYGNFDLSLENGKDKAYYDLNSERKNW